MLSQVKGEQRKGRKSGRPKENEIKRGKGEREG